VGKGLGKGVVPHGTGWAIPDVSRGLDAGTGHGATDADGRRPTPQLESNADAAQRISSGLLIESPHPWVVVKVARQGLGFTALRRVVGDPRHSRRHGRSSRARGRRRGGAGRQHRLDPKDVSLLRPLRRRAGCGRCIRVPPGRSGHRARAHPRSRTFRNSCRPLRVRSRHNCTSTDLAPGCLPSTASASRPGSRPCPGRTGNRQKLDLARRQLQMLSSERRRPGEQGNSQRAVLEGSADLQATLPCPAGEVMAAGVQAENCRLQVGPEGQPVGGCGWVACGQCVAGHGPTVGPSG
jgi:hypothetical protein